MRGGGHKRGELRAARHVGTVHLVRNRLLTLGLAVGGLPADAVGAAARAVSPAAAAALGGIRDALEAAARLVRLR